MITVANRTETAARIKYAFESGQINVEELCDSNYIIHIDSKTFKKAEAESGALDVPAADDETLHPAGYA
jgi:type III restriction enzyme